MTKLARNLISLFTVAFLPLAGITKTNPDIIPVKVKNVYIPEGFDSNDVVEIVIDGEFPNLCYSNPVAKITKQKGNSLSISVGAAEFNPTFMCAQVIFPFSVKLKLEYKSKSKGEKSSYFPAGTYDLKFNQEFEKTARVTKKLKISEAKSDLIDDYLYAAVQEIKVRKKKIVLIGANPTPCHKLVEIEVLSNGENSYSVLPKLERLEGVPCAEVMTDFRYHHKLRVDLNSENVLFHVRSMGGLHLNQLVPNPSLGM